MAGRYIRDKNGRFAAKGGGTKQSGKSRSSRDREDKVNENLRVGSHRAFKPYDAALGKSVYAHRKVKKLEKAGAEKSVIEKARKDAATKESTTRAAGRQFMSQAKINNRRYKNASGLIKERRYTRPK